LNDRPPAEDPPSDSHPVLNNNVGEWDISGLSVNSPEKHGEGFKDAYVTYLITSRTVDGKEHRVRRRYQDFLWLLERFQGELQSGIILPPLPEKNRLEYLDRFSPEFIQKRQLSLERFLARLMLHDRLASHPMTLHFLTKDFLVAIYNV